ncbi:Metal reductase [bioreactor metagenome]|uniref:Metal reductase n=1 Tax=bioreactor metagenome TaxID=1076179 RepID=A0A645EGU2_9ZZZZ
MHPAIPADAKIKKHIAVIGAGPAGCNFALQAAARGHKVDLYEKSGSIGGKMNPGSTPKGKFDFNNYRMYVEATVIKAAEEGMIDIFLNTECDLDTLKKKSYDTIVTAIGTKAAELNVPGYENMKTAQATELLENPELLGEAKKVVIIGGGVVGCETAYWLSFEKNMDVTVLEMLPYLMDGACTANRGHLIYYMKKNGVKLINMAMVKGFENSKVKISRNTHKNVPNPYNTWQPILPKNIENPLAPKVKDEYQEEFLDADLVVFAMGGKPDDSLYYALQEAHAAHEIYNIGDSFTAGRVLEANRAAYNLAVKL